MPGSKGKYHEKFKEMEELLSTPEGQAKLAAFLETVKSFNAEPKPIVMETQCTCCPIHGMVYRG